MCGRRSRAAALSLSFKTAREGRHARSMGVPPSVEQASPSSVPQASPMGPRAWQPAALLPPPPPPPPPPPTTAAHAPAPASASSSTSASTSALASARARARSSNASSAAASSPSSGSSPGDTAGTTGHAAGHAAGTTGPKRKRHWRDLAGERQAAASAELQRMNAFFTDVDQGSLEVETVGAPP
mmetsp:Transcript_2754/g.6854  ORF Transcript_2754/g.6854 Transcript_2754/m.6854 type:complete len:184 (-) Transcript_2754:14-565(-)